MRRLRSVGLLTAKPKAQKIATKVTLLTDRRKKGLGPFSRSCDREYPEVFDAKQGAMAPFVVPGGIPLQLLDKPPRRHGRPISLEKEMGAVRTLTQPWELKLEDAVRAYWQLAAPALPGKANSVSSRREGQRDAEVADHELVGDVAVASVPPERHFENISSPPV